MKEDPVRCASPIMIQPYHHNKENYVSQGTKGGEHIKKGPGGGRSFIPSPSLMTKRTITVGILGGDRGYMVLLSAAPAFSL